MHWLILYVNLSTFPVVIPNYADRMECEFAGKEFSKQYQEKAGAPGFFFCVPEPSAKWTGGLQ